MIKNNYCVVEYSHSQNKFHCDYFNVSFKRNLQSIKTHNPIDWINIGIFETWEEAQEFIKNFEQQLKNRN